LGIHDKSIKFLVNTYFFVGKYFPRYINLRVYLDTEQYFFEDNSATLLAFIGSISLSKRKKTYEYSEKI